MKNAKPKVPHVPLRTCIGCQTERPKKELLRIVKTPEGALQLDGPKGKLNGRGAYVCPQVGCFEQLLKRKALQHAFKCALKAEDLEHVKQDFVSRLLREAQE